MSWPEENSGGGWPDAAGGWPDATGGWPDATGGAATIISINDITVAENAGIATFTVTRAGDTSGVSSVDWATASGISYPASAGSDYVAESGTVSFGSGETTKSITITITSTANYEFTETFVVNLTNPIGCTIADAQGICSLTDVSGFPTASSVSSPVVIEGGILQYTVTFPRMAEFGVDHSYSFSGDAVDGVDYTAFPVSISNTSAITATTFRTLVNTTSVVIGIQTIHNAGSLVDKSLILTVDSAVSGTGTITDYDSVPVTYGDSLSSNNYPVASFDNTATTDTLNINDGATGQVLITPPTGTFIKTVHKVGSAVSKVFTRSRLGYVRLDVGDSLKLGLADINIPNQHAIGVLCRMANANTSGYTGEFQVLKTSQLHTDGNPLLKLAIGGLSHATTAYRGKVFCERAARIGDADSTLYQISQYNSTTYGANLDLFGATPTKLDSDWFMLWQFCGGDSDTTTLAENIALNAPSLTYLNRSLVAHGLTKHLDPAMLSSRYDTLYITSSDPSVFTASADSSGVMTVSAVASGTIKVNEVISGGSASDIRITAQTSGAAGGVGTYTVKRSTGTNPASWASTTVKAGGYIPTASGVDFIVGSGSSGASKVIDIARVMIISGRPTHQQLAAITNGAHPTAMGLTNTTFELDGLKAGIIVNSGAPSFTPVDDGVIATKYHGDNSSDVVLSFNNQRVI